MSKIVYRYDMYAFESKRGSNIFIPTEALHKSISDYLFKEVSARVYANDTKFIVEYDETKRDLVDDAMCKISHMYWTLGYVWTLLRSSRSIEL